MIDRRRPQVSAATVLLALATGCDTPLGAPTVPDDVVAPTTVGLIAKAEQKDHGVLLTLEHGGTVLLPLGATDLTGQPNDAELVIVGTGDLRSPTVVCVVRGRGASWESR